MISYENLKKVNCEFEKEFKHSLSHLLERGTYILGEEVELFEKEFATYIGTKYCVGVGNGLDALYLSIRVLDLPNGSEIIVPSNTYIASIIAIINAGCIPILVEPDLITYNINPLLIEEKISSKTRAIMTVHLYGRICNMKAIMEIAKRHQLFVIEDCAQSHGACLDQVKAGNWGDFGAFSFYPTKNLGALGDGGAVLTNNEEWYHKLKALRNYGSEVKYYNKYIGINSRLDELQAGFLRIKLKSLDKLNAHKRKLAALYAELLPTHVEKPPILKGDEHVYHIYNIRCERRDGLREYLLKKGISTEIHYPIPPHLQKGFKELLDKQTLPISELIHSTTLSLPISYFHSEDDIIEVCDQIKNFFHTG